MGKADRLSISPRHAISRHGISARALEFAYDPLAALTFAVKLRRGLVCRVCVSRDHWHHALAPFLRRGLVFRCDLSSLFALCERANGFWRMTKFGTAAAGVKSSPGQLAFLGACEQRSEERKESGRRGLGLSVCSSHDSGKYCGRAFPFLQPLSVWFEMFQR